MKPNLGIIGTELYKRLQQKDWKVRFVVDVDGVYRGLPKKEKLGEIQDYTKHLKGLDLEPIHKGYVG